MEKKAGMLLTPLKVGEVTFKNRFVVAPMVTVFCDQDGMATDRFIAYHEAKAKGGWGLIIVEDYAIDPIGRGFWTPGLWKDEQIASHARLVEAVHNAGAKIIAQIYHAGRQTSSALVGAQPVSSSPVPCPVMGEIPRELSKEDIATIVKQFGEAALRAKKAGFDGVEVHGAHGYLIAQFMSKYANKRIDEYGGPLKNRLRFPLEIIAEIRSRCGQDFLIDFRISGDEHVPGGRSIAETKAIAAALEEAGLDMIHVSVGTYESVSSIIPPMGTPLAWITDYAAEIKQVVKIPVITVGRINDPLIAEQVLLAGKADLIAMGRGSLADPELPNKYAEGRYEDIRHCIGCQQGCLEILFRNEPIRCLVNPTLGFEYLQELKKAPTAKKVTVVGGGPAGLEAARAAAMAGHQVTLYEKEDRLGGQFLAAAVPPGKGEITSYLTWAGKQLEKLGVTVKLNTSFDEATLKKDEPEVVIVATGACQSRPPIKGIEGKNVVEAKDLLMGKATAGQKVVVAGGGMVGCETATFLASMGRAVTIVEMLPNIATDEEITRRLSLLKMLAEKNVQILTGAEIKEITETAVRITKDGKDTEIGADTVVLAVGMDSVCILTDSAPGGPEVKVVGDAVRPRNALEAIREGFLAGASI
ncbi:MAG: FAD-dependent oxidoreductase [Syntrophales bacterium]|nr:FAD-dependent oxidoreductase [Syntrophales bacterium]